MFVITKFRYFIYFLLCYRGQEYPSLYLGLRYIEAPNIHSFMHQLIIIRHKSYVIKSTQFVTASNPHKLRLSKILCQLVFMLLRCYSNCCQIRIEISLQIRWRVLMTIKYHKIINQTVCFSNRIFHLKDCQRTLTTLFTNRRCDRPLRLWFGFDLRFNVDP